MSQSKWGFNSEEDEKLIEAISAHPALYDLKHELYKDQRAKDNIWIIVAGEVGRSVADCKKRWKNMKDTFDRKNRDLNKTGSEAPAFKKGKKAWALQDRLSFLRAADEKRRSFCNVSIDPDDSGNKECGNLFDETEENDDPFDVITTSSPSQGASRPSSVTPPYAHLARASTSTSAGGETQTEAIRKKSNYREKICSAIEQRSKERDAMIKELLQKDEDTSDDISHFFRSIEKTVRKFPVHLQQRAKIETLTLISKIENDMWCTRTESRPMYSVPQRQVLSSTTPSPSSTHSDSLISTADNNQVVLVPALGPQTSNELNVNFLLNPNQERDASDPNLQNSLFY